MADPNEAGTNGEEEKMKAELKDGSESDDSSSDDDMESEQKNAARISELESMITANPYDYDGHLEMIKLLREDGELDKARSAREKMNEYFPLTGEIWLEWIQDEMKFEEDRNKINDLFDRAVKDYLCIDLWLEYCQYSIGALGTEEGLKDIRDTYEEAVTAGGLHVTKGAVLWESYREFENALLAGMQPGPGSVSTKEQEEKIQSQMSRINSLFKRQLSIPLQDMAATWEEYKEWQTEDIDTYTKNMYEKALEKFNKLRPHESAIYTSDPPHLTEYLAYIDYELSQKEPARVQCLFERAIAESNNCLVPDLWERYTKYLDEELQIRRVCVAVHRRAVRNCPSSGKLWTRYLRCLERFEYTHEEITEVFDKAFTAGFASGEEYLSLWTCKCDYMRRRIEWDRDHDKEVEDLRKTFESALEFLNHHFPADGDPNCTLMQYWARFEAKFGKNMEKARELWNEIMTKGFGNQAQMWLEYFNLERSFGDHKHCRKVLQRAVNSVTDWTETMCDTYINFEREEGTLEQYDQAVVRCNAQLKRARDRQEKAAEKEAKQEEMKQKQRQDKRAAKKVEKQQKLKPPAQQPFTSPSGSAEFKVPLPPGQKASPGPKGGSGPPPGFKAPPSGSKVPPPGFQGRSEGGSAPPPGYKAPPPGFKPRPGGSGPPPGFVPRGDAHEEEPQAKRPRVHEEQMETEQQYNAPSSVGKENQTVFVSNLDFTTTEDDLLALFSRVGEINEVRLVKNFKGKSKGYAYIEYKDEFPVEAALKMDRETVEGRPMFVSRCETKSGGTAQKQFRYATNLEKNKLFVKNLPFTVTKEALETVFSQHGTLKEVRLVTYRSGAPKGLAYVEFETEASAKEAVLKCDGLKMGEHEISVSISNPPPRKAPVNQRESSFTPSLGGGKKDFGSRKAHTQLSLMPRAVQRAPPPGRARPSPGAPAATPGTDAGAGDTQDKPTGKMSNADFRNMLLKK